MSDIYGPQNPVPLRRVIVCITVMISIAHFAVATVYGNDCPREPFIPYYLWGYLSGVVILLPLLFRLTLYLCVTAVFLICWLIAGSIKIFSIYEPDYNKNITQADSYCNKTLYLYSVWSTAMTYVILFGFLLVGGIDFFSSSNSRCKQLEQKKDKRTKRI